MTEKCTKIAMGGVFSGLCLLMMFLSSMVPLSSYAASFMAGAMLLVVVLENGAKTAFLVYMAVGLASIFIVPDIEAKLVFIGFAGYYVILKMQLEKLHGKLLLTLLKLIIFNVAIIAYYYAALHLFGITDLAEQNAFFGRYMPLATLVLGNITFLVYDLMLTRLKRAYIYWFRPKFLRGR